LPGFFFYGTFCSAHALELLRTIMVFFPFKEQRKARILWV